VEQLLPSIRYVIGLVGATFGQAQILGIMAPRRDANCEGITGQRLVD